MIKFDWNNENSIKILSIVLSLTCALAMCVIMIITKVMISNDAHENIITVEVANVNSAKAQDIGSYRVEVLDYGKLSYYIKVNCKNQVVTVYTMDENGEYSIPIKKMMEKGYDKIVVVLTRPLNYQKNKLSDKKINMIHRKFQKYPNLINAMENRYQNYNETTELIKKLESENKIFVIRPQTSIDVKVIERDKNKLQNVYDMGIEEMKKNLRKLKEYLEIGKED